MTRSDLSPSRAYNAPSEQAESNRRILDIEALILIAIAIIAAIFVGFSTLCFVIQKDKADTLRLLFLSSVADLGLASIFGSIAPLLANRIIGIESLGWRISAGIAAVIWGISWFAVSRAYWKSGVAASFSSSLISPDHILNVAGILILLWVVILNPSNSATLYTVAMLLLLAFTAGSFVGRAFASNTQDKDDTQGRTKT